MRLTIIRDDNTVYIDGQVVTVDCSSMLPNYHAVQWYEDHGEIETRQGGNIQLTDLKTFQAIIRKAQAVIAQGE